MRTFTRGATPRIVKVRGYLIEADSEKRLGLLGMLLSPYVVRIALLVAVAAASFAVGMVVMEVSSKTGNHPLYFTLAVLVAIGALLLATLLSYRVVEDRLIVGIVGRRMRCSRLKTNPSRSVVYGKSNLVGVQGKRCYMQQVSKVVPEHFVTCSKSIILRCRCGQTLLLLGREADWRKEGRSVFQCSGCGKKLSLDAPSRRRVS
jgi:hypothetical protein